MRHQMNRFLKYTKLICIGLAVGMLGLNIQSASALTDGQRSTLSQNCTSIKASLQRLQKADSRTRVFLGTSYEHILSNFIAPLNVRLAKNNKPNSTLTDIQVQFATKRTKFTDTYTTYMKNFDTLLATDCVNEPDIFYQRLETLRNDRKELHNTAVDLRTLTNKNVDAVKQLRDSL